MDWITIILGFIAFSTTVAAVLLVFLLPEDEVQVVDHKDDDPPHERNSITAIDENGNLVDTDRNIIFSITSRNINEIKFRETLKWDSKKLTFEDTDDPKFKSNPFGYPFFTYDFKMNKIPNYPSTGIGVMQGLTVNLFSSSPQNASRFAQVTWKTDENLYETVSIPEFKLTCTPRSIGRPPVLYAGSVGKRSMCSLPTGQIICGIYSTISNPDQKVECLPVEALNMHGQVVLVSQNSSNDFSIIFQKPSQFQPDPYLEWPSHPLTGESYIGDGFGSVIRNSYTPTPLPSNSRIWIAVKADLQQFSSFKDDRTVFYESMLYLYWWNGSSIQFKRSFRDTSKTNLTDNSLRFAEGFDVCWDTLAIKEGSNCVIYQFEHNSVWKKFQTIEGKSSDFAQDVLIGPNGLKLLIREGKTMTVYTRTDHTISFSSSTTTEIKGTPWSVMGRNQTSQLVYVPTTLLPGINETLSGKTSANNPKVEIYSWNDQNGNLTYLQTLEHKDGTDLWFGCSMQGEFIKSPPESFQDGLLIANGVGQSYLFDITLK